MNAIVGLGQAPLAAAGFEDACEYVRRAGWYDGGMTPHMTDKPGQQGWSVRVGPEEGLDDALMLLSIRSSFLRDAGVQKGDPTWIKLRQCYQNGYDARQMYDAEVIQKASRTGWWLAAGIFAGGIAIGGSAVYFLTRPK